jgi:hypothetical protein
LVVDGFQFFFSREPGKLLQKRLYVFHRSAIPWQPARLNTAEKRSRFAAAT